MTGYGFCYMFALKNKSAELRRIAGTLCGAKRHVFAPCPAIENKGPIHVENVFNGVSGVY